ncbi:MAG: hypothetical protein IT299_01085 [Dehalococcoidia bacterium]|nr:hypothetical protein [Dehalococcoidia bacterium]
MPGDRVEASIGGRTCATTTVAPDGYWLLLVPEGGACGAKDGDTVSFRVNGQSTSPTAIWKAGGTPADQSRGIVLLVASGPTVVPTVPPLSPVNVQPEVAAPSVPNPPQPSGAVRAPTEPVAGVPPVPVSVAAPVPWHVPSAIANTGGEGVVERYGCAVEARRAGRVLEGAPVVITFVGIGPCEGWFVVDAEGHTTWLDGQFLVPSSIAAARSQLEPQPRAVSTPAPITEVRIVSRLRWYERMAQDVEPAGVLLLVGVFLIGALLLLPKRSPWP